MRDTTYIHINQSSTALGHEAVVLRCYMYETLDKAPGTVDRLHIMFTGIQPAEVAVLAKQDQGPKIVALVVSSTVLALICVILRVFARIRFTRLTGWEDYFIVLSMVSLLQHLLEVPVLTCTRSFRYLPRYVKSNRYNGVVASTRYWSIFLRL
jgi:hypothetical protein